MCLGVLVTPTTGAPLAGCLVNSFWDNSLNVSSSLPSPREGLVPSSQPPGAWQRKEGCIVSPPCQTLHQDLPCKMSSLNPLHNPTGSGLWMSSLTEEDAESQGASLVLSRSCFWSQTFAVVLSLLVCLVNLCSSRLYIKEVLLWRVSEPHAASYLELRDDLVIDVCVLSLQIQNLGLSDPGVHVLRWPCWPAFGILYSPTLTETFQT